MWIFPDLKSTDLNILVNGSPFHLHIDQALAHPAIVDELTGVS